MMAGEVIFVMITILVAFGIIAIMVTHIINKYCKKDNRKHGSS